MVSVCVMNNCLVEEIYIHSSLTSALEGCECSYSSSGSYVLGREPIPCSVKTWLYPRGDSSASDQRKIDCLCWKSKRGFFLCFPVCNLVTKKQFIPELINNASRNEDVKQQTEIYTCTSKILIFFIVHCKLQSTPLDRVISKSEVRKGREAGNVHRWFTGVVLLG